MVSTLRVRAAIATALLLPTGCSFVMVRGPPPPPIDSRADVQYTTRSAAPALDLVGGGLLTMTTMLYFGAVNTHPWGGSMSSDEAFKTTAGAAAAVILIGSAVRGFFAMAECSNVQRRVTACRNGTPDTCSKLGLGD